MTHQITSRPVPRVKTIPHWRRAQPVKHIHIRLTDEQHAVLKRDANKMNGFRHAFIRYPDDHMTIIQGRDTVKILCDLSQLFPDVPGTINPATFYIRDH